MNVIAFRVKEVNIAHRGMNTTYMMI